MWNKNGIPNQEQQLEQSKRWEQYEEEEFEIPYGLTGNDTTADEHLQSKLKPKKKFIF
jgi:hypothetical protein